MSRVTSFFDFDQQDVHRETRVWEHLREVDEFIENIQQLPTFGTLSAADLPAVGRVELNEVFAGDDRFDDAYRVFLEELFGFVADRRQRSMLDFDQFSVGDDIDPVVSQRNLLASSGRGITLFELAV